LSLFFFVAGLELKRELLVGSLRRPADAAVPIVAALAGVATPALVFTVINVVGDGDTSGWAIPAATDIAFALAVMAVVGSSLPSSLRAFLLTLAVVDDLVVIVIIAVFYTSTLRLLPLLLVALLLATYALLQHRRVTSFLVYVPLAAATWWCMHESGVHATIAGVALGLLTRVLPDEDEAHSPAERLEHRLTPLSAGVAVPFFALLSAGVVIGGGGDLLRDPVVIGVVLGLVVGKPVGVLAGAWGVTRFTRAELNEDLSWRDVLGVAVLAGVGFTVALLVAELSFAPGEAEAAKTAVLAGSVAAALLAAVLLGRRSRVHAQE
jgi:NhaA family Na+:H+ antiporter